MSPAPPKWAPAKKKNGGPVPTQPVPAVPAPATIDDARAEGLAVVGTQLAAPLSPKNGPIPGEAGSLVVTVIKDFWKSPTIIAIKNAVLAALGLAGFGLAMEVVSKNGNLSEINWQTVQKIAIGTVAFSLASAYAAWWKRHDNDPIKQG